MLERTAPLPSPPVLAGQELSRRRRAQRRSGAAGRPPRDGFAATARLNGRSGRGGKAPCDGVQLNRATTGETGLNNET